VIIAHLGNIPAYCLEFATEFLEQLNCKDPKGGVYCQQDIKQVVLRSLDILGMQAI
jgi:hypothetical protein